MSRFCGFDLDRVAALQRAVAAAPDAAQGVSRSIGQTSDRAADFIALGQGVSPHNLGVEPSADTDPDRVGLRTVSVQAPDVAADIGRRLRHLAACEQLSHDGFRVDASRVFDDEAPPDEAKINAALQKLHTALNSSDLLAMLAGLTAANGSVTGLNRAETEALVGALTPTDLRKWNVLLSLNVLGVGLSPADRTALSNSLLSKLSNASVRSLVDSMPSLEPSYGGTEGAGNDDQKSLHWQWADGPLVNGVPQLSDITQGDLGDCWFLAGLGAEVRGNPNFVQQHVQDNGNGTYTVTFYNDGRPVPVTVDGRLPYNSWNSTAFEHPHGANWVAIYEKAFAEFRGGYPNTEGGYGSQSMQYLTGNQSAKLPADLLPPQVLAQQLASGKGITAGTPSHHSGFLWLHSDEYFDNSKLVTKHEYIVTSVDMNANPPTVTVRNPWGNGGGAPETVTMSYDEFRSNFDEVSIGG